MSREGNPLFMWAMELKAQLKPPVEARDLFNLLIANDTPDVQDFYYGINVPQNPIVRQRLQNRIETLQYVSTQVVVN